MSTVYERLKEQHKTWLKRRQITSVSQGRVLLVGSGQVGLHVAARLKRQELAQLTIFGLQQLDLRMWAPSIQQLQLPVIAKPFSSINAGILMNNYDLVIFANERPYPTYAERINELCYRNNVAWTQLQTWGSGITLGPSVLPGITACYECYQQRLHANDPREDVRKAREHFFSSDLSYRLPGQIQAQTANAALYAETEVVRLLGQGQPPLALSRELQWDWLRQQQTSNHITPAEYCSVCRGEQTALHSHKDTLEDLLERLVPATQPSEVLA